jgi:beta-lactamase class A
MAVDAVAMRTLQDRIEAIATNVAGIVGVWAEDLGSGATVSLHADTVFPLASVVKAPILVELYRQAEAGQIDLAARLPFEPRQLVPGSGILQDLDFGLTPTVKDLATLMITVSDNAATDMILGLIGLDRLNATVRDLGLGSTTVPMTIRELLYSTVGLDAANPEHTYDLYQQRSREGMVDWTCRAYADTDNNLSTPRDLARLLAAIERRAILSAASCAAILDILKRQKYNTVIPLHIPDTTAIAHKTGSLRGVRNDAGIVYGPQGPYVIVVCSKRLADPVAGAAALAQISKAVYEVFGGPIPAPRYGPK